MAMSKSAMADKIMTNLKARNNLITGSNEAFYKAYWEDICQGIIDEIKANMDITTSVTVPGVQSGSDTATGTGTDTSIS